jgi:hypothetical protein
LGFDRVGRLSFDALNNEQKVSVNKEYGPYARVFDGLRSFYEFRSGDKSAPAFRAASVLSLICILGLGSALMLIAMLAGDPALPIDLIFRWRIGIAVLGVGIAIAIHVGWAKRNGLYTRIGAPLSTQWVAAFLVMAVSAAALLMLFLITMYVKGDEIRGASQSNSSKLLTATASVRIDETTVGAATN